MFAWSGRMCAVAALLVLLLSVGYCSAEPRMTGVRRLESLAGLPLDAPWYSGYLLANKTAGNYLFFILCLARVNSSTAPLTLWLQGGPGASSMMGLFLEQGPVQIQANGSLTYNPFSWTNYSNMLYIDQPAGTGYSYTTDDNYAEDYQEMAGQLYNALQHFYSLFPQFNSSPFFITGESYGGHFEPTLATTIHKANQQLPVGAIKIPLTGMAIGDGWIDPVSQIFSFGNYDFGNGLIDENQRAQVTEQMKHVADLITHAQTREQWMYASWEERQVEQGIVRKLAGLATEDYILGLTDPMQPQQQALFFFLNNATVQSELGTVGHHWKLTNDRVSVKISGEILQSTLPMLPELIANYRVLFYVANMDMTCNIVGVNYVIQRIEWPGREQFFQAKRGLWLIDKIVAGYAKNYENFSLVVVRNSGHEVPFYQPYHAQVMFNNFVNNLPFFKDE